MVTHPLWRPYTPSANAERQAERIAHRQAQPGPLHVSRASGWETRYRVVEQLVRVTIPDQVLQLRHVGSTAVNGLLAKPVLDVDLVVPAVADEPAYLPRLEAVGFRLIFRDEVGGDAHRQLTFEVPNTNLHVWSPGATEPQRHAVFLAWLRGHAEDRERYAAVKRLAAAGDGSRYNDLKSEVVYDIYERAFLADPSYPHDPQPR